MLPLPGSKQWLLATGLEHYKTPGSYVGEHSERKYRKQRHIWPPPHMANKVPRVASSWSMAQHHLLAETKSPVLLKPPVQLPDCLARQQLQASQLRYNSIVYKKKLQHQTVTSQQQHRRNVNLYQGKSNRSSSSESTQTLGSFEEFELVNWRKPRVGKFNSFIIIQIS